MNAPGAQAGGPDVLVVATATAGPAVERTLAGISAQLGAGRVTVVDVSGGLGSALGSALADVTSPFVLIVRAGVVPDPHCLDVLLSRARSNRSAAVVAPLVVDAGGEMVHGGFGKRPSMHAALVHRVNAITSRLLGRASDPVVCPTSTVSIDWVSADCALVRVAAFTAAGAPDVRLTSDLAMAEWCGRMLRVGSTVLVDPLAGCVKQDAQAAAGVQADLVRYATICGMRLLGIAARLRIVKAPDVGVAG